MIPFPDKKYNIIYADPPWKYGKWGKASDSPMARKKFPNGQWEQCFDLPYPAMSVREIADLPVANLASDNCDLYLSFILRFFPSTHFSQLVSPSSSGSSYPLFSFP